MRLAVRTCLISLIIYFNILDCDAERVVLVSPVLSAQRNGRAEGGRAKDFPLLMVLAPDQRPPGTAEVMAKPGKGDPQPIYVKKLKSGKFPEKRIRRYSSSTVKVPQINRH